ncbi:MAG TPA: hypothetical protein VFX59_31385 [Polyangiales bacterium]|nr:hypothetical protein [Polyangiales bacterium]
MSEEQFREQLVDYLYGELDGAQRAAFEKELEAPERRAELEAMRATLRTARTGLAALDEEPPARLRGAILDAERASRNVIALKPWYRRAGTITPMLAAAAALTFAVLAPRRDEQPRLEPQPRLEQAPPPLPAAPAVVPPADDAPAESKGKLEARGTSARERHVEAPAEKEREARPPLRAPRPAEARKSAAADERADDFGGGFAAPPAGWGSGGGALGRGAARERALDKAEPEAAEESVASAPPPRAAAPASPSHSMASEQAGGPAKRSQVVSKPGAELASGRDAGQQRAPDELVQRAREHASAHRWSEAVLAYRELLQRFPKDERAASWRSELGSASRALTAVPLVP